MGSSIGEFRFALVLLSIFVVGSCSDSPVEPAEPARLVLEPTLLASDRVGDTLVFHVRAYDGEGVEIEPATAPELTIVSESPDVEDLPVVEPRAGDGLTVVTRGPGTALLEARLGAVTSNPANVSVTTPPLVTASLAAGAVRPGDEVELVGWRLNELASVSLHLGADEAEVLEVQPDRIRFKVPESYGLGCTGAGRPRLALEGAVVLESVSVRVARDGETALRVGEWSVLGDSSEGCLRLPPGDSTAYTLAFMDARGLQGGLEGPEDRNLTSTRVAVSLADRSRTSTATVRARADIAPPLPMLRLGVGAMGRTDMRIVEPPAGAGPPPEDYFRYAHRPWTMGDRISVDSPSVPGEYEKGTVVRVYDGGFVWVVLDKDAEYRVGERLDSLDEVMNVVRSVSIPLLRTTFGEAAPVTPKERGQLVSVISDFGGLVSGFTSCSGGDRPKDVPSSCYIGISPGISFNLELPLFISSRGVTHELAHTWQWVHLDHVCVETGRCGSGIQTLWALEGTATLLEVEAQRQIRHRSFTANASWTDLAAYPPRLVGHTSLESWSFGRGYGSVEWFLRDQVWRAMAQGVSYEDAMAAVNQGAIEGWNGYYLIRPDPFSPTSVGRHEGLVRRMEQLLDRSWDPLHELLRGLVALAVDDLTDEPSLQNPSILRAWETLTPSGSFEIGQNTVVEGGVAGLNFAYFRIEDPGEGGTLRWSTSLEEGLYWVLARTR